MLLNKSFLNEVFGSQVCRSSSVRKIESSGKGQRFLRMIEKCSLRENVIAENINLGDNGPEFLTAWRALHYRAVIEWSSFWFALLKIMTDLN